MSTMTRSPWQASDMTDPAEFFCRLTDQRNSAPSGDATPEVDAWQSLVEELLRIRTLRDDWDAEGAEAPDPHLVDAAVVLAEYLRTNGVPAADRVLLGINATIFFEWYAEFGYLEVEVFSPFEGECRWIPIGSNVPEAVPISRHG